MITALLRQHVEQSLIPVTSALLRPQNLGRWVTRMPARLNRQIIQTVMNHMLRELIDEADFEMLEDRHLLIEILDANVYFGISFKEGRFVCRHCDNQAVECDARLSVDTLSAIRLIRQEVDPDTLFFRRKLKISGDTELAHFVKNTIDTLSPELVPVWAMRLMQQYRLHVLKASDQG